MTEEKRNIVLVVMDTARASDTSFVQDSVEESFLNELASEGARYTQAFTNAPWTLPSHTSMFSGTYTSKHGTNAERKFYDNQFPTLAEILSDQGYKTVGFTNNAWVSDEFGLTAGFDEMYKVWQYIQTDTDFGEIKLTSEGGDLIKNGLKGLVNGDILANIVNGIYGQFFYRRSDYGAKRTNSLVRDWLQNRSGRDSFFMFINYLEPHLNYQPPERVAEQFLPEGRTYSEAMNVPQKPWEYVVGNLELSDSDFELLRALYRAEIAYLDEQLRELKSVLVENKEWEDTVFVVVGDHGENIGDHRLMDHQYSVHDSLIHVPLIISGGEFAQVRNQDQFVQTLDLYPTILDTVGVSIPPHSQGVSFHPESASSGRDQIIAEYLSPQPSLASLNNQTGIPESELERYGRTLRTIRIGNQKLIRDSAGSVRLYDVAEDPNENTDISGNHRTACNALEQRLDSWIQSFEHATGTEGENKMSEGTKRRLEDLGYI